ncbi:MAG: leucine--tRNA ligase [Pirellulales bacterium]|nr:leucine--tRNA ligase [Pirellulales bacterium]
MPRYNPSAIEPKWQEFWNQNRTFATPELPAGEKLYVLDMFPYPSGAGLHVGHPEGYTATDIVCRYQRMQGKSVLHPMGFDAFGLPAEEYAIKEGVPPRESTEQNIITFTRQLKRIGFSYDWDRVLATTDVEYFRWTQWIFLQLYDTWYDNAEDRGRPISELPIPDDVTAAGEDAIRAYRDDRRLAYQAEAPVNWCPELGTVLANEEVKDGKSERGGHPVVRMPLRQWMLRITAYADRLERDLESLDWSYGIKKLQADWIGRSTGADVDFFIGEKSQEETGKEQLQFAFSSWKQGRAKGQFPDKPGRDVLRIYTTRPDTLFGATYMVIAPEHPFVERLTTTEQSSTVKSYCEEAAHKSDLDRTQLAKKKTGVFTGSYAINPVNGEEIPIWIGDYVLISYGTGAIMAVPAHDERDFEFAQVFDLPVRSVYEVPIKAFHGVGNGQESAAVAEAKAASEEFYAWREEVYEGRACYSGEGKAVRSEKYNGLQTAEFKERIIEDLTTEGAGRGAVNYKLRDWLFSRQRFWGEPFPVLHELDAHDKPTGRVRTVPESDLPVNLPHLDDFKPHGRPEPPLDKAPAEWLYPVIDGVKYKRETNTMPQWAGSCWYYLRFIDPRNDQAFIDPQKEKAWMPVDLYIGGAEHAVLHLLYARFWHKVLFDRGYLSTVEPFQKLVNQGMILGEVEITGYQDASGGWVSAADVKKNDDGMLIYKATREAVSAVKVPGEDAEKSGDHFVLTSTPSIRLVSRAEKMSKSRGNVINPDEVIEEYGADALRLYEMFMGPLEATKPWSMAGVSGVKGFLDRAWRMVVDERSEDLTLHPGVKDVDLDADQNRALHRTIKAVTEDIESLSFNTAIARMMEFVNFFTKLEPRPRSAMEQFVLLLSPFAPHIAEEMWNILGHEKTLAYETWPTFDETLIKENTVEIPVQINGKIKVKINVAAGADKSDMEAAARSDEKMVTLLADAKIVKVIVVPGRLVNFVVAV